jgi:hypothetical protein
MAIDRIPDDVERTGPDSELHFERASEFAAFERMLCPIASNDELCVGAHHLMCRVMLSLEQRKFLLGTRMDPIREVDRRFIMALSGVNTYLHGDYEMFTDRLRECTTADRVIVLGFTCMFARDSITGDWKIAAPHHPMCGGDCGTDQ